jgi:hypothetical protein
MTFSYPAEVIAEKVADRQTQARIKELEAALSEIRYDLSDVGTLFDGHDELNEHTHEDNANHMERALDRINEIAKAALGGDA